MPLQLAALGFSVVAVDFCRYPYLAPELEYKSQDISRLMFPDGSFDAVTSISTFEHVGIGFYADPKHVDRADVRAFSEVRRVLKKGGLFVFSVPCGVAHTGDFQRIYSLEELDALLAGFTTKERRYYKNSQPKDAVNNFWSEVPRAEALRVLSSERTEAVCLVKARKI